jgi:hypothetical protein
MLGEHDFFETIDGRASTGWIEQIQLLAVAQTQLDCSNVPKIKGGRGGAGGVIDATQAHLVDTDTFDGGDGGAALVLLAPEVVVEEDAHINLQGEIPAMDATAAASNSIESLGIIPPERGRGGKFGIIADEYTLSSGAVKTNAAIVPTETGELEPTS